MGRRQKRRANGGINAKISYSSQESRDIPIRVGPQRPGVAAVSNFCPFVVFGVACQFGSWRRAVGQRPRWRSDGEFVAKLRILVRETEIYRSAGIRIDPQSPRKRRRAAQYFAPRDSMVLWAVSRNRHED